MEVGSHSFTEERVPRGVLVLNRAFEIDFDATAFQEFLDGLGSHTDKESAGDKLASGRGTVGVFEHGPGIRLAVRRCLRGGLMERLLKSNYFRWPLSPPSWHRPVDELYTLAHLIESGIPVPTPVAAVIRFRWVPIVYRACIATRMIEDADTLFHIGKTAQSDAETERFQRLCSRVGEAARAMLRARVFHRDLHLANVIVDRKDEVFIIDFDNAKRLRDRHRTAAYAERLVKRWQRFTLKHGLDALADEPFREALLG